MNLYCNPLNLDYGYQHYGKGAHREGADPTLIYFKGRYYMFVSMCRGFFYSDNLTTWKLHENDLDIYRYAPDVREIDGNLVFCASTRGKASTFWRTDDPLSNNFEKVSEPFDFWDPDLFQDTDGRCYLYWGCDCNQPIFAREMDRKTLLPLGEKKVVIGPDVTTRGWERPSYPWEPKKKLTAFDLMMKLAGRDGSKYPYFEGAYMTKVGDNYYLQYAAPATQNENYGNGTFIGKSPMGPFTYQVHNPISLKTGGFAKGAGHGSTIQDKYGNLWHVATMKISQNANFERRCGLFPAAVDKDGILYTNQNFADYPMDIPEGKFDIDELWPKYMLLSYKKKGTASSIYKEYCTENAFDEDITTCWCAQGSKDEWLEVDLGDEYEIGAIQINIADVEVPIIDVPKKQKSDFATGNRYIDNKSKLYTRYLLEGSTDGTQWFIIEDKSHADDNMCNDFIALDKLMKVRYIRVTSKELPYNKRFAICGLRVFGLGNGQEPNSPKDVKGKYVFDDMTAEISWTRVEEAIGYNIRYGVAPDKLYLSHLVYEDNKCYLAALNKGQQYYFTVDSFNENGIKRGNTIYKVSNQEL